ncbi:MAG: hypothetical protein ACXVGF_04840 [Blastococcus sp.]
MTQPTPAQLDQAVIDAMRALAVSRQSDPADPAAVEQARQDLIAAREARGYGA